MGDFFRKFRFASFLILLIFCALLLILRVVYLYVATPQLFPVNTYKISASYEHISRKQIENVLADFSNDSFISMSTKKIQDKLASLDWAKDIQVNRIWPDTLKITIIEKSPVVYWNNNILTNDDQIIAITPEDIQKQNQLKLLPELKGPDRQRQEVLQNFQKFSKLLGAYGLRAVSLNLSANQSWSLSLADGVILQLGKKDIESRLLRFCKAYAAVFADKPEQISRVDLRYAHGMAVQWNGPTNK